MKSVLRPVRVSEDDYDWFVENHPGYGRWTAFVREALSRYRAIKEIHKTDHLNEAVASIIDDKTLEEEEDGRSEPGD